MNIDKQTQEKIQELKNYEQIFQNILIQKQTFQFELIETENALNEISESKDDIFKLIGNIMIKADKKKTEEDLKKRKDLLLLRLRSLESQEKDLTDKTEELKKEVTRKLK
mgnify:CR=1 FL=1